MGKYMRKQGENGRWYLTDMDENRLDGEEYDEMNEADRLGIFRVVRDGKVNAIRGDGKMVSDTWFDGLGCFDNGYAVVRKGERRALIDVDGNILFGKWYDRIGLGFGDSVLFSVREGCVWNFIGVDGNYIGNYGFETFYVQHGYAIVSASGKENVVMRDGSLLFSEWKDAVFFADNDDILVVSDGGLEYAYRLCDGKCITPGGYEHISRFLCGTARAFDGEKYVTIDVNGNVVG